MSIDLVFTMAQIKRFHATVHGRVQGVSFRHFTQLEAQRLGVMGWVANHQDGTVRVVAEGPENVLLQFEKFLRNGPPTADVSQLDVVWKAATGEYSHFSITWL